MSRLHFYFLLCIIFAACTTTPVDDGSMPPPLFPPFNILEINLKEGYKIDLTTGDSIKPVVNSFGDTVKTGVPIPVRGKRVNMDTFPLPKPILVQMIKSENEFQSIIYPVSGMLNGTPVDWQQANKVSIPPIEPGNTLHFFLNSQRDTVATGYPFAAKGTIRPVKHPVPVAAQLPQAKNNAAYDIQCLDKDLGLSEDYIQSLMFDRKGNLWIGTQWSGFSRYDGGYFHHYKERESSPNNKILAMLEDRKGNIWLGKSNGMRKYDGERFIDFSEIGGFYNDLVSSIIEDSYGNIWAGTFSRGISRFTPNDDGESGTLIHYTTREGLSSDGINTLLEDRNGNIWIGTYNGGVNVFKPSTDRSGGAFTLFTRKEGFPADEVFSLIEDKKGSIWIAAASGLYCYTPSETKQKGTIVHYSTEAGLPENIKVSSILEDTHGIVWVGTLGGGLYRFTPPTQGKSGYFLQITQKEGLPNNFVTSLAEDPNGQIWAATGNNGIYRLNWNSFRQFMPTKELVSPAQAKVLEDSKGYIWLYSDETLKKAEVSADGHVVGVYSFPEMNDATLNKMAPLLEDKDGSIWFSGGLGVWAFKPTGDGNSGTLTQLTKAHGLLSNYVWTMTEDRNGNLWLSDPSTGISRYQPARNGNKASMVQFSEREGLSKNTVLTILADSEGKIWLGSDGGGITRFEPSDDGESGIFTHFSEKEGLSQNIVISSHQDTDGVLWFGTWGGGVNRFDGKSFTHFTEREGLSHNRVPSIIEDRKGRLWLSTLNRLSYIIKDSISHTTSSAAPNFLLGSLDKSDGVNIPSFFSYQPILDSQNRLIWASDSKNLMLDLNVFQFSELLPEVRVRQLRINDAHLDYLHLDNRSKDIKIGGVLPFENLPTNLELPYWKNHLTFFYTATDLSTSHHLRFSHRIVGLSKEWSTPTADLKADYRNISPGTYIFQVRAAGQSQQWSSPYNYTFTIHPPWWLTWWAYLVYGLLVTYGVYRLIRWRTLQLKKENELLDTKVKVRTLQLQKKSDELSLSLQNLKSAQLQLIQSEKMASLGELTAGIAHEIQNPLNFVNNFSEVSAELVEEVKEELIQVKTRFPANENEEDILSEANAILDDIKGNLEKITHHGKRADAIVKGMLAHSRTGKGAKEPTDINALAEEYLKLSYHGLRAKDKTFNADFKTDFDPNLPKVIVVPQDIGRVLLNLINNAFQACAAQTGHAPSPRHAPSLITVTTRNHGDHIEIFVKDNGPGIPDAIKDKIFQPFFTTKPTGQGTGLGLSLSYDIVKAHGGEINCNDRTEGGTEFIIKLPRNS